MVNTVEVIYFKSRTMGRLLAILLVLSAVMMSAGSALAAIPGGKITLAWTPSTTPGVTGYRLYYGTQSGSYLGSVSVGNTNSATITGLYPGTTYFFAATAVNSAGTESAYSTEMYYTVLPTTRLITQVMVTPAKQVVLSGRGPAGYTYEVLGSPTADGAGWSVLARVTTDATGAFKFLDASAPGLPSRFYRLRQTSP